jgi:hypothetical protein
LKQGGLGINLANLSAYPPSREAQGQSKSAKDDEQPDIIAQAQNKNPYEKMSYRDKLVTAAKMVPDLLVGDAKAAFQKLISDPGFILQLGALAGAFVAVQTIPGVGQVVDVVLIAALGFAGGWHLAHFLLKAHEARDKAGLQDAAGELKSLVEIVGVTALAGVFGTAGKVIRRLKGSAGIIEKVTVGRWMSPEEFKLLQRGIVPESLSGTTHVALPANPNAFLKQAKPGSYYVEFDVPATVVKPTQQGWAKIVGPNSLEGRLARKKGLETPQMPTAENIVHRATKLH